MQLHLLVGGAPHRLKRRLTMEKKRWSCRSVAALGLAVIATAVFRAAPASAQTTADGFSIGLGGGFAQATGLPFRAGPIGYYMLTNLEFPPVSRFFRPRVDGLFANWGGGERVSALTASVLFTPLSGRRVAPYLLAGAGAYLVPGSTVKSGWTLGAGLRLPGELRALTLESRLHAYLRGNQSDPFVSRWRYMFTPIGLSIQF
jgi:hypothetical protein